MPALPQLPYYIVDHVLSTSGGTGIVYWGIDKRTHYAVAIKELYEANAHNPYIVESFRQEANSYAYLNHPNITKLVDFVVWQGRCFLIMEFLEGVTLDDMIRKRTGLLTEERVVPIFRNILHTIDYIHNALTPIYPSGALHLDIKPSNVMMMNNGGIKIMDMGISAKLNDTNPNRRISGTPSFMPPEQYQRGVLGTYTDVFALGVTLYFMLTAHLPFTGKTRQEIWTNIYNQNFLPPQVYYPYMNSGWEYIVRKATDPNPNLRYQNCREFEQAIMQLNIH